jgi:hypothetical protein
MPIAAQDLKTAWRAEAVARPRPRVTLALLWMRVRESWDVRRNIHVSSASGEHAGRSG